jgi:hypothetical protein
MSTPMYCHAVDAIMLFALTLRNLDVLTDSPPISGFYRYRLCTILDKYKYPIHKVE